MRAFQLLLWGFGRKKINLDKSKIRCLAILGCHFEKVAVWFGKAKSGGNTLVLYVEFREQIDYTETRLFKAANNIQVTLFESLFGNLISSSNLS